MHVLHGTWLSRGQRFVLWGEDTAAPLKRRGGKRARFIPHPYLVSIADWWRHLSRYAPGAEPQRHDGVVWLPGVGGWPLPSPPARAEGMAPPEGAPRLLGWRLRDAVTLGPTEALGYLLRLPRRDEPRRGFIVGNDLRFWQRVGLLAMNCLVEQRYLPTLEERGGALFASWRPQPDGELLPQLAAVMPLPCRAHVDDPAQAPSAMELIDAFVLSTVDAFVREADCPLRGSVHPWLRALIGDVRRVGGGAGEGRRLWAAWQQWRGTSPDAARGDLRVYLRLQEPAEEGAPWHLAYLLQAADDPSLFIEAETVWSSTGRSLRVMERHFDNPQEELLAALGVASRIFPPIERSLRQSKPLGVALTPDEVHGFLTEAVPLLTSPRFVVMVPDWWRRAARLKARVTLREAEASSSGLLNLEALVSYRWELFLGGEPITRCEFEELVALRQPMVRFRGQWVTLDPEQVQAALRFLQHETGEGALGLLDALRLKADEGRARVEGLDVETVAVEGRLRGLLSGLSHPERLGSLEQPQGLCAALRPYQERGVAWLAQMRRLGLGACLADDMGLGKTLQAIALWLHARDGSGAAGPVLVVCPTSVVGNWRHEIARFAPSLRVAVHHGPDRLQGEAFAAQAANHDAILTSYALLSRDRETLAGVRWSEVILDEAQNIKNPATRQAQAARALPSEHRIALTGTPVENRVGELWSILQFLNPGYLGSREAFRSRFAIPIERYGDEAATATLRRLVAPFILRRVKTDPAVIADLPAKFENKTYCTLTSEQATLYEAVVREELERLQQAEDDIRRSGAVLRMLTRLKQVCNHPAHFLQEDAGRLLGRSGKLARLVDMLAEVLDSGERALVFTQYAAMGRLLQPFLAASFESEVLYLHGGTPAKARQAMIERFQAEHGPPVFILSLKAGGTGLNLTGANHVFHYDRWYNPAVENQATDRAFRIGQTKDVQVHKLICLGTLEERIDAQIEHKLALAESVVGTGELWLAEMSNEALRDLVTLRREVVEED